MGISISLAPCHICRRKPTVRAELDAFADCEGCGERACYVCIRECLGSAGMVGDGGGRWKGDGEMGEGHKGMVCSRCCVERGTEGEVWCLGCLGGGEGG